MCHASELPGTPMVNAEDVFAMNWRFFPTLDPQVNYNMIKIKLNYKKAFIS